MIEKKLTYLEKQLESQIEITQDKITITFQKEKIKLQDELEVAMLQSMNPYINKEITITEDELILTFFPRKYHMNFKRLLKQEEKSRWMFASHLTNEVMRHSSNRLHLFICPENILIDESMMPIFLHYGLKESVPPYEKDEIRNLRELKALIASVVEPKHSFEQYYEFADSIEQTPIIEKIIQATDVEILMEIIQKQLKKIVSEEKYYTKISYVKRNWLRYAIIGLLLISIPLGIYSGYAAFILQPRQEAYIYSQEHFLQKKYSEVINTLVNYEIEDMPKVIQYELSISYIVNETLTEEQKDNVLSTITLQTDSRYYQYWILLGRGQAEEALKISRQLEDLDLIMLALLHYEEEVKLNDDLKEEERDRLLNDIKVEKEEYERQIQELQEIVEGTENSNKEDETEKLEIPTTQNEQEETNGSSQSVPTTPDSSNEIETE